MGHPTPCTHKKEPTQGRRMHDEHDSMGESTEPKLDTQADVSSDAYGVASEGLCRYKMPRIQANLSYNLYTGRTHPSGNDAGAQSTTLTAMGTMVITPKLWVTVASHACRGMNVCVAYKASTLTHTPTHTIKTQITATWGRIHSCQTC